MALMALTTLTGCDYFAGDTARKERANRDYTAAMADYRSGRIDQAVKTFAKVCRNDPGNASARFQYACLLQDSAKDYFGAMCCYREYTELCPDSDKTKLTNNRLKECERLLAQELAEKYSLTDNSAVEKRISELTKSLNEERAANTKLKDDIADKERAIAALSREAERLRGILQGVADTEDHTRRNDLDAAMALLKDEELETSSAPVTPSLEEQAIIDDDESTGSDLITRSPDALAKREAREKAAKEKRDAEAAEKQAKLAKIPDTYVVQEGDTLYKIAVRFYGHSSMWKNIRDENKAIISTDGRIRAGQKLTMPKVVK